MEEIKVVDVAETVLVIASTAAHPGASPAPDSAAETMLLQNGRGGGTCGGGGDRTPAAAASPVEAAVAVDPVPTKAFALADEATQRIWDAADDKIDNLQVAEGLQLLKGLAMELKRAGASAAPSCIHTLDQIGHCYLMLNQVAEAAGVYDDLVAQIECVVTLMGDCGQSCCHFCACFL